MESRFNSLGKAESVDIQDSDLSLFCDNFRKFLLQIQERKKRGHNDYNPLLCVQKIYDEVWMHSGMLHSLLDAKGLHYQGNLFLDLFLEVLNLKDWFGESKNAFVLKEWEKIDIFISNGRRHIILENKIWASDQDGQLARYIATVKDKYKASDGDIAVIYLTLDKRKPSENSLSNEDEEWKIGKNEPLCNGRCVEYRQIAYGEEVLQWLEKAQYEVCNIKNLDSALGFYIDVLKQLLQIKENAMSVKGFFENKEKELEIALEIIRNKGDILSATTEYIANYCKENCKKNELEGLPSTINNSQILYLSDNRDDNPCFCFSVECEETQEGLRFGCSIYLEDYGFLEGQYYCESNFAKRESFKKEIQEILDKELNYTPQRSGIHCLFVEEAEFSTLSEAKEGILQFINDNKEKVCDLNKILRENTERIKEIYSSCLGIGEAEA